MSVTITAQVPGAESLAASSQAAAPTQGTGATTEQGLIDYFVKARLDAGNGQTAATNSVASSGEMLGKLRDFIEKAHQTDAKNQARRVKQKEAAAQAKTDLATFDTFGSVGQFGSRGQSYSVGQFTSLNRYGSVQPTVGLPPGPASESLGRGPGFASQSRLHAMADKMTNDLFDSAIQNMWTQVVTHATTQVTKSVMTLLKGQ